MSPNVQRREFITLLGGAVVWPLAARAQQSKVARIGALYIGIADEASFKTELCHGCGWHRYGIDELAGVSYSVWSACSAHMLFGDLAHGSTPSSTI
jgi:hypothetical protein